jgi:cation transport regulator ChaB
MADTENTPVPDPTILTTEALARAIASERDFVIGQLGIRDERLRGIDTATRVLNETVNRVPTDMQKEIQHVREITDEKFDSVGTQFKERDTRSERESRDNKLAVDAAFAAQEKQAAAQNKSNAEAINKSEIATAETINKLAELFKTTTDALRRDLDDIKLAVGDIQARRLGVADSRTSQRSDSQIAIGVFGLILTALIIALALYAAVHK